MPPALCSLQYLSPPYRRFVGNYITTRERLSWSEIDQVIQILSWREAKRIGFKAAWEKTTWQHSLPVDFILAIGAEKQTVQPFISSTETGQCTGRLISDPVCSLQLRNSQQTTDLHTAQGWLLSMAASLTRIPGDTYNGHFNECYFYSAGCWLHSVWSPLALKVQVDVRASRIYSQTGGNSPLLTTHRPSSCSPDLVRLKAGNPAPVKAGSAEAAKHLFTLQRGRKEEERESRQCVSCDLHPNLQFGEVINFAGWSYSKMFSVCVVWK